jgi:hypothetical protein
VKMALMVAGSPHEKVCLLHTFQVCLGLVVKGVLYGGVLGCGGMGLV